MLHLTERRATLKVFCHTLALIACWLFGRDCAIGFHRQTFKQVIFREPQVWTNFLLYYGVKIEMSGDMNNLILQAVNLSKSD